MHSKFPLFQSHLDFAHLLWKTLVKEGDTVIDATCGNGSDSLVLAELALTPARGSLYAMDIQSAALERTQEKLKAQLKSAAFERSVFIQGCHSQFPSIIASGSVKLIVYNLGYLPGGNKTLTTQTETTLQSLKHARELLQQGGALSITCYPGHPAGKKEEEALVEYTSRLDPREWSVCRHQWTNRRQAPGLLIIQKRLQN